MIRSSTDILMNEVVTSMNVAFNQRSRSSLGLNVLYKKKNGTVLATRFNCMQAWFIRCSWLEKFKFLKRMLHSLSSLTSLSIILNTVLTCSGKSSIYSLENNSNFVYDKALNDHNRGLHNQTLQEVQENDFQWFKSLQDDSEQVLVFIGLLRLGGGVIMYETYKKGVKLFEQLTLEQTLKTSECSENQRFSQAHQTPNDKDRFNNVSKFMHDIDPTDPYVVNTAARKEEWDNAVRKYKAQVESRAKAVGNLEKKTKPAKKSKKEKGSKREDSSDLDFLQLIPITLVKRIFNYLDAATLKRIKSVNKYWEYAVKDLLKEQKGRKNLDKFIKKMEKGLSAKEVDLVEEPEEKLVITYDKSYPKKRVKKLWNRGAVLPKLVPPLHTPFVTESWISKSDNLDEYFLQVQNLQLFPRNFSAAPVLYKHVSFTTLKRRYTVFNDLVLDDETDEKLKN